MTTGEMIAAVRKLRDEITVEAFGGFGKQDRCASMALTKLDEAEAWLIRRGVDNGSHLLIDKAHYAAQLEATQRETALDRINDDTAWAQRAYGTPVTTDTTGDNDVR